METLTVDPAGRLLLDGVEVHGGVVLRCCMDCGWCDVLVAHGPAPDVQSDGWYAALPWECRGESLDGKFVQCGG